MKIIITGATSFIATEFTKLAVECGNDVYAICRNIEKARERFQEDESLHLIQMKMDEYSNIAKAVKKADVFIHFAWDGTKVTERDNEGLHTKNIQYTLDAMKAAKRVGCSLFVDTGSQAEYGVVTSKISENTDCNPFSEYGKAKLAVYEKGKEYCESIGIKYLHLRIFSVFGENDHPHTLVMSGLSKLLNNSPLALSECNQYWNFLYIRDAVQQIYRLINSVYEDSNFLCDVYNIASNDTRTLKDFVYEMKEITQSQSPLHFGEVKPEHIVSLDPDISKTFSRIYFVSNYTFNIAIEKIIKDMRRNGVETDNLARGGVRNNCILCGRTLPVKPLIQFENMPSSAQNIPDKDSVNNDTGITLSLHQCPFCGLVQLDSMPVDYYKKVIRAGGGSSTMFNLRRQQYSEFVSTFNLEGKTIAEIGCGQGEFLKMWDGFNVRAIGIEYDKELVNNARNIGLEVYKAFAYDASTHIPESPFDAFVQFNFLEHQIDPNGMVQCIYNNLKDDGVGLVTVPSLEYILKYDGYYELIRDHLAYYSESALRFLFEKNGFEIVSCKTVNRDTHSIMVRKRHKVDISSWSENYFILKKELHCYIDFYVNQGKKVAVWGASHQGFTLIPSLGLSEKISYIIDSAPFKQGKFAPASHVPIVDRKYFFEEPVASILIVAPGYTEEIAEIIRKELSEDIDIRTLRSNHLEKI